MKRHNITLKQPFSATAQALASVFPRAVETNCREARQHEDAEGKTLAVVPGQQVRLAAVGACQGSTRRITRARRTPNYHGDLTWTFGEQAPDTIVKEKFETWKNISGQRDINDALLAPATVAFGWHKNEHKTYGHEMSCACGLTIAFGHEEKLEHVVWVAKHQKYGTKREQLSKLEKAGHVERPVVSYLANRLLVGYAHLIRTATIASMLSHKERVEYALRSINGLLVSANQAVIDQLVAFTCPGCSRPGASSRRSEILTSAGIRSGSNDLGRVQVDAHQPIFV